MRILSMPFTPLRPTSLLRKWWIPMTAILPRAVPTCPADRSSVFPLPGLVCRRPEIFIFDDSFLCAGLQDRPGILRDALNKDCGDATRIIVAQRIGTIRDADKIIVLADGKIAGMGTHDQLMQNCEVYQQIALSQLSKEELA